MFCSNCGNKISEHSQFCGRCGCKVTRVNFKTEKNLPKIIKSKEKTTENLIGKKIIPIIASVLIFIGVVTFGTIAFSRLNNITRSIILYLCSFVLLSVGIYIFKKKNVKTIGEIIMGCGVGSLYIATLICSIKYALLSFVILNKTPTP